MSDAAVVISVVYDGPPEAGKTTSVRALAKSFGREVHTPEEADGRTVFYDWMEHIGGRFEGAPLKCQVVSVPGQRQWAHRRAHLLASADVVVFVGDTSQAGWPETIARLTELRGELDARTGAPVGLVFQANKRDLAGAVGIDEIKAAAANARIAIVESVAEDGTGIREAFVFAIRLAIDRVRADIDRGFAALDRIGFGTNSDGLLDRLRGLETIDTQWADTPTQPEIPRPASFARRATIPPLPPIPVPSESSTPLLDAALAARAPIKAKLGPRPPTHDVPSGFVWPPLEGRILLRDAAPEAADAVRMTATGDCIASMGSEWRVHSTASAVFADLDDARRALVAWARHHTLAQAYISPQRCIVLAETGDGRWRLWQIVARSATLRDLLDDDGALERDDADRLVEQAIESMAGMALPCTLDTLGMLDTARPVYVGLMPHGGAPA
ncbi:MAG TPA: GTPase domain-containing protein [Kofleriaceae bacterium]